MSAEELMRDLINTPPSLVGLTVEQYHRMIDEVIINLLEKLVEVYESPIFGSGRYASPLRLKGADQVSFPVSGARIEVEASKLLP